MNDPDGPGVGRRTFLRTAALAGAGALAGVGGADGDGCRREHHRGELLVQGAYERHTYEPESPETAEIRLWLSADEDLDLDLYVTLDGREPTSDDYDRGSWGVGTDEAVTLAPSALDGSTSVGIAVHSRVGTGGYRLTIAECEAGEGGDRGGRLSGGPDLSLSDLRLVQTVADTRAVRHGSTLHSVPDPDPVAGDYTAVLFDVSGSLADLSGDRVVVTVTREDGRGTHADSFPIRRGLLNRLVNRGAETPAVLHRVARETGAGPPVFRIREDTSSVEVALSEPGAARPFERATLRARRDFPVRSMDPITVGFVPVEDPDRGSNYGNGDGQCLAYGESVANAIAYLRRVLPGELAAYRHDEAFVGAPEDPHADYVEAYWTLDDARSAEAFPDGGSVTTFRTDRAAAIERMRREGFDAAVMVAPGNKLVNVWGGSYFGHHYDRKIVGWAPGEPETAVGMLETGGVSSLDYRSAHIAAQEIGHRFVDDPYRGPAPDHPLAQRDDDGSTVTVDGDPVDLDHTRHRLSNGDRNADVDAAGVLSTAFDLTDGTYSLVNGYSVGNGEFSSHGPRTNVFSLTPSRWPSYMSYTWRKPWADARMHQAIVDAFARDDA